MSNILNTVNRAIDSATYNPEAEKAATERVKRTSDAKKEYKDLLVSLENDFEKEQSTGLINPVYSQKIKILLQNAESVTTTTTNENDWLILKDNLQDNYSSLNNINKIINSIQLIFKNGEIVSKNLLQKKEIDQAKYDSIKKYLDDLSAWLSPDLVEGYTLIIVKDKIVSVKQDIIKLFGTEQSEKVLNPSPGEIDAILENVKQSQELEDTQFSLTRLIKTIGSTTYTIVISLLYVMIALVSGMLCANDAIGRKVQYRILYFIHGFVFAPAVLVYYLYRWFAGTAPDIYRLLPIYTTESNTSLGRFLLFPFTYVEDDNALKMAEKFLSESGKMVGVGVGVGGMNVVDISSSQTSNILEQIKSLSLNNENEMIDILNKIKGLNLPNPAKMSTIINSLKSLKL